MNLNFLKNGRKLENKPKDKPLIILIHYLIIMPYDSNANSKTRKMSTDIKLNIEE